MVRNMVKIVIDAFGGDYAPVEVVAGAIAAVNKNDKIVVVLSGKEDILKEELSKYKYNEKQIEIIEAHAMPDHIHMLVSIPPNEKVSSFMGYLKGKSTMIIFERYAHMKYKVGNRHFWSRGYYVSTVGGNKQAVQKYIQHQETEDLISNQISMVEYYDPFKKWLESNQNKKK